MRNHKDPTVEDEIRILYPSFSFCGFSGETTTEPGFQVSVRRKNRSETSRKNTNKTYIYYRTKIQYESTSLSFFHTDEVEDI